MVVVELSYETYKISACTACVGNATPRRHAPARSKTGGDFITNLATCKHADDNRDNSDRKENADNDREKGREVGYNTS